MKLVLLVLSMVAVGLGQTPNFEVASVKATAVQDGSLTVNYPPGGRYSAQNLTVKALLGMSYGVQGYQILGGRGWVDSGGFDIEAKAAGGVGEPTHEQVNQMVQALLADRFQLALHRETRQLPIYVLVAGKTGAKMLPGESSAQGSKMMMGQLIIKKMSMTGLANILTFDLNRPVIDQTGLKGEYAFTLEWTPGLREADAGTASRPSLFTAVEEQLGLKLESTKGPVEVLVIDRVEKPSEN